MLNSLLELPPDPLFQLAADYRQDSNPHKLNLGIGVYQTETGEPWVMSVIQKMAAEVPLTNFDYAPIGGIPEFLLGTGRLLFGMRFDSAAFASQATCGGTGACWLLGQLLKRAGYSDVLLPTPTWVNHQNIFADFSQTTFRHLDEHGGVNVEGYRQAIAAVVKPTILLLHGGPTHNPTGRNLSIDDLRQLIPLIRARPVYVLIDFAYLGLGDGIDEDAAMVRLLIEELADVAVAISFSKNATLYCQRTGALFVKTENKATVASHLRAMTRASISNPPAFGQKVMVAVFERGLSEWQEQLREMRQSLGRRREALARSVPSLAALNDSRGLFAMLPVTPEQVQKLRQQFSLYMPDSGRINISGLRLDRMDDVVAALQTVL